MLFEEEGKAILEALLFVSNNPLTIKELSEASDLEEEDVAYILGELRKDYKKLCHGIKILKIADGYSFVTKEEYYKYLKKLYKPKLNTLSTPALETLSIIAYKEPIIKLEIEEIRGVNVDKTINTLLNKGLIEEKGRKDSPGRPILYATTKEFLKYFGLDSKDDLPEIENIS